MSAVFASTDLPLRNRAVTLPASPVAGYAAAVLADLGADISPSAIDGIAAQRTWARSGAMALTVDHSATPLPCPAPLAACMEGAWLALNSLKHAETGFDAAALLGERAAVFGYSGRGAISPGGACRLLTARDGTLALNLPRTGDWELLPALLQTHETFAEGGTEGDWEAVSRAVQTQDVSALCARGRLLGLALAPGDGEARTRRWCEIAARGEPGELRSRPLVVDLSSLWAGPLCSHVLQIAGARVIKVESTHRPDGARNGPAAFFDLLNAGKRSVALDLTSATGIERLQALLRRADIIIEASRPRALQQMGIIAEELVGDRPGLTWISITGYGRDRGEAIAFGDDAGVAAGLSALYQARYQEAVICGDAIADPLTGMHAALAAVAGWVSGGGYLFDISLHAVTSHCARQPAVDGGAVTRGAEGWQLELGETVEPVRPPRARHAAGRAADLGADTERVLDELGIVC